MGVNAITIFGTRFVITAGSGIPDPIAILYYKNDPNVVVVTRDGKRWRGGEIIERLHDL